MNNSKKALIMLLPFLCLVLVPQFAQAATIPTCSFNKDHFIPGETGFINVTIYNDLNNKIRVTSLTATVEYFYTDENVYLQTFYTDETVPVEVERGETITLQVPFSLPTNIAPGYIDMHVKAETEIWGNFELWSGSDHPTSSATFYVESPYKQQFENQQTVNSRLQEDILNLQAVNQTTTNVLYLLGLTTVGFLLVSLALILINRKPSFVRRPPP